MDIKQGNLQEIIDSERELFLQAPKRYGEFFSFALDSFVLTENFIKSINQEAFIFAAFLSQIRKHHTLAFFSSTRLHHIQTMMNIRQVLEAGVCAGYAIAFVDPEKFARKKENTLDFNQDLIGKRYKWIEDNYPQKSEEIKRLKDLINSSAAHSNIVYAHKNYSFDTLNKKFNIPFFDFEDEIHVKADLWLVGNVAMGIMDFLYGVNLDYKRFVCSDDYMKKINNLQRMNEKLKQEALKNSRFSRFD